MVSSGEILAIVILIFQIRDVHLRQPSNTSDSWPNGAYSTVKQDSDRRSGKQATRFVFLEQASTFVLNCATSPSGSSIMLAKSGEGGFESVTKPHTLPFFKFGGRCHSVCRLAAVVCNVLLVLLCCQQVLE